jgi:hypothetical protein
MVIFDKLFGRLRTKRQEQPVFAEYPKQRRVAPPARHGRFEAPGARLDAHETGVCAGLAVEPRAKVTTFQRGGGCFEARRFISAFLHLTFTQFGVS